MAAAEARVRGGEGALAARLAAVGRLLHNQDNREHDILDSADYAPSFQGGPAAVVEMLRGAARGASITPTISRPEKPVVRTLGEEIGRVVRGRATNPKWIAGMMRHGLTRGDGDGDGGRPALRLCGADRCRG